MPQHDLDYLEVSERGIQNLKERNVIVSNETDTTHNADVVIPTVLMLFDMDDIKEQVSDIINK